MTDQPKPRNPALGLPLHEFPYPWASDWGEDEYGIWVAFTYRDIRYAFRWITPGTFLMGSPEDEPERGEDEIQHQVTLTGGFWLGETTVTQELWTSLMGFNASRFGGPDKPVENISWAEAKQFIKNIRAKLSNFSFRLPTEAEWEYACRAGRDSPFHFGRQVTIDQVNYNGRQIENNAKNGEYRKETVEVRALQCNRWGLWQMHGNVWEWCEDWYGPYTKEPALNPKGPDQGTERIQRGGSCWHSSGFCRSACRARGAPEFNYDLVGLRLAADHPTQSE